MPRSVRIFGISSTSAGGPQTKHSVAGSWTSSSSASRFRRPRGPLQSASVARVTVCRSSISPGVRQAAQLLLVRELVRRPRAVEQPDVAVRHRQRMAQHRAQRRDAGAAGDEDEAALVGHGGKRERAERPFDVDELPGIERQMRRRACRRRRRRSAAPDSRRDAHPRAPPRSSTAAASRGRGSRSRPPVRARSRTGGRRGRAGRCARAASPAARREMGA